MKQNNQKDKNTKKQTLIIVLIVVIAVSVLAIVSIVIFNRFFKEGVREDARKDAIIESWDESLKENEEQARIDKEMSDKIIKKHSLDFFGKYVSVYNESAQSNSIEGQPENAATESVTTVMMINEDYTIDFSDGRIGWWSLSESEEGIIHMGCGVEGAQTPGIFMLCDGYLVDVTGSAVLYGIIPKEDTFDCKLTDGNLTFTFNKDGTLDAEYTEMVTEEGVEFPYTEIYSGEYRKNGQYMDIMLNGSTARYIIFSAETNDPQRPVSGIAARYFTKADA